MKYYIVDLYEMSMLKSGIDLPLDSPCDNPLIYHPVGKVVVSDLFIKAKELASGNTIYKLSDEYASKLFIKHNLDLLPAYRKISKYGSVPFIFGSDLNKNNEINNSELEYYINNFESIAYNQYCNRVKDIDRKVQEDKKYIKKKVKEIKNNYNK